MPEDYREIEKKAYKSLCESNAHYNRAKEMKLDSPVTVREFNEGMEKIKGRLIGLERLYMVNRAVSDKPVKDDKKWSVIEIFILTIFTSACLGIFAALFVKF